MVMFIEFLVISWCVGCSRWIFRMRRLLGILWIVLRSLVLRMSFFVLVWFRD